MERVESASAAAGARPDAPVLLCWTDVQSGEDVWIRVFGSPEFASELEAQGFRRAPASPPGAAPECVVAIASG